MRSHWEIMSAYLVFRSADQNRAIGAAIQNGDQTVHAVEFSAPHRYSRFSSLDDASDWLQSLVGGKGVNRG